MMSPTHAPGYVKNPDHTVRIVPSAERVRAVFAGTVIGETLKALRVEETGYPPVYYLPRGDLRMTLLSPTEKTSHCPFKGDASYWAVSSEHARAENAAWSYDDPYIECRALSGHIAFYPDKVTIEVG